MNFTQNVLGKIAHGPHGDYRPLTAQHLQPKCRHRSTMPARSRLRCALPSTGDFFQAVSVGRRSAGQGARRRPARASTAARTPPCRPTWSTRRSRLGVQGIIIQHGLTESMKEAAQRAVDAGIKVVAFDVNVEN